MYIIFTILATILQITSSKRCKTIECVRRGDEICYVPTLDPQLNVDSIKLSQCKYGQQCVNFNDEQWTDYIFTRRCTASSLEYRNSYPYTRNSDRPEKDYCDFNSQCASAICEFNRCVGIILGDSCTSKNSCVWSAYCDFEENICKPRLELGQSCTDDRDCPNNAACSTNNICIAMYSIGAGGPDRGSDVFCKSGLSVNGICEDYSYMPCNPETQTACTVTTSLSKTVMSYGTCNCNPNGSPVGICSPVESTNAHWNNYIEQFDKISANKCPYESSSSCINIDKNDYFEFKLAQSAAYGVDIEEFYCLINRSSYLRLSFVILALITLFI